MTISLREKSFVIGSTAPEGYVSCVLGPEDGYSRARWSRPRRERAASLVQQLEMVPTIMPIPVTHEQAFKIAEVEYCEPALRLLSKLYRDIVLDVSSLCKEDIGNVAIAVGMLAAAGLCNVDPIAVRLSPKGKQFVESLVESRHGDSAF